MRNIVDYAGNHGTEINYIIGTLITNLTNLRTQSEYLQLTAEQQEIIIVGWNYLDGIFSLMLAFHQLTDTKDYRRQDNRIKRILNLVAAL